MFTHVYPTNLFPAFHFFDPFWVAADEEKQRAWLMHRLLSSDAVLGSQGRRRCGGTYRCAQDVLHRNHGSDMFRLGVNT